MIPWLAEPCSGLGLLSGLLPRRSLAWKGTTMPVYARTDGEERMARTP